MKLHARMVSDKGLREEKKSGDEFIEIDLIAFNKKIGTLVLETIEDAEGKPNMYMVKYAFDDDTRRYKGGEWAIIEEGHRDEGVVQRMDKLV